MTADSEVRSRYLALALDARKILDVLSRFVETGERTASLDEFVNKAIRALGSISQRGMANFVHSDLAFDQYEQALTLDEIESQYDREGIIQDLKGIVAPQQGEEEASAMRALEFFFALESRALQYYNRPPMRSVGMPA